MLRPSAMILAVCVAALGVPGQAFPDLPLQSFVYHEGFEAEAPALDLWAKNGPSTVNESGPTAEKAFEGKHSLKLDVSLEGGSYHYFGAPVRVPCTGSVKLSARVFVAEGTSARVGFGVNMVYPPTHHSGCGATRTFEQPTGQWELVEVDLVDRGTTGAESVVSRYTATARGEDVGAYCDRWSLFIYGGEGKRAIVYVDDVRIEGEVPSEEDYEREIDRRWAAGQKRLAKRIEEWRLQLSEGRAALARMPEAPEAVRGDVEAVQKSVDAAEKLINALAERGYGDRHAITAIESALFTAQYGPETIAAITRGVEAKQPYLVYTPEAISNTQLATTTFPIPARIGQKLACSGCPGEFESMTAAIYALEEVKGLLASVTDLAGPSGTIPAAAIDIHHVMCWYQAGKDIGFRPGTRLFVPELLVKDPALIRVDREKEENHLRSTAEDGKETYLLCSGATSEELEDVRPMDAAELQPVDIPERALHQFWFTAHIPADAAPGVYSGRVAFTTAAGTRTLPLEITVHPFGLLPPRLTYSIYYRAKLSKDGLPTIGSEYKSEEQYRAEIEDMRDHGVLYPTNYQGWSPTLLPRAMDIRREAGLPADRFYNLGRSTGNPDTPEALAALTKDVQQWVAFCREYGYGEVYFYGIDEARDDRLASQRAAWKAVQDAGGKTFVACYKKTFESMGSLLDCAVLAGRPGPEEGAKWHSVGSEAFCYAYPQVGNEEPETYRRNFGLVLWKAGFDGAMDYAYQHGFNHVWNDFDSSRYRDHNFSYPAVNGIVGTIQWEGFREAVDDVRYVTTLEHAIRHAPPAQAAVAEEAQAWLDEFEPETADLYEARQRMAAFISRFGSE